MTSKRNIHGLLPEDLVALLGAAGEEISLGEARRLVSRELSWRPGRSPTRHPVRRVARLAVERHVDSQGLEVVERVEDPADGFIKYLLRSPDGALTEAVRIPLQKEGLYTVCLSSQVGCAMGCDFCATGRLGLTRHLEAWEMVSAFRLIRDETEGRISGAVFMGQGEPLHNYDAVIQAARVLSDPCGGRISARAISISTVGLVPEMLRYAGENHPFRLVVSLTSAVQDRRARLLPVANRYKLPELGEAIRALWSSSGDRVTIAWVLIGGLNTDKREVDALRSLLGDVPIRLNLIDVNDPRPDGYRRATEEELNTLMDDLQVLKVPVVRRYSGGRNKHAACGMLHSRTGESMPGDPQSARGVEDLTQRGLQRLTSYDTSTTETEVY
ncbi:MAG: radical SAM protein [Myxococcota bacterium]|nr:radical SAM protein [Myxococcota bacterium]